MTRVLIWDLPTRLFHWLLAGSAGGALGIALTVDDHSRFFQIHMLLGLVAGFLVLLRVVWGLLGSRHARFGSFIFGPGELLAYLRGVLGSGGRHYPGHNPGAAVAIWVLLLLSLGLSLSGIFQSEGEVLEELHEVLAYILLATIGLHLAGLLLHTLLHRENIALSMVHGKREAEASQAIPSSRPLAGAVFLALVAGWVLLVFGGHDPQARRVTLLGQTISLGEHEGAKHRDRERRHRGHDGERSEHDDD